MPSNVIVELPLPPATNVRPFAPPSVSVPFATVSVTSTGELPASTSPTEITLPFTFKKTSDVSGAVVWATGTVLTGGSFTAPTVSVTVAGADVASPSLARYVNESGPL